jgi:hypothetical protein
MMASTLRSLSLYTEHRLDPSIARPLLRSLTHLTELRLETNAPTSSSSSTTASSSLAGDHTFFWLADVLEDFPLLRRLSVSEQDCQPPDFANPALYLEHLEFISFCAKPDEAFFEFAKLAQNARGKVSAKEIVFVADRKAFEERVEEEEVREAVEVFEKREVRFEVVHEIRRWQENTLIEL